MKYIKYLSVLLLIASCGGGGGGGSSTPAIPFAITLGSASFSVNEDNTYTGPIAATANEVVTLTYAITTQPSNGTLNLSTNGDITYIPSTNCSESANPTKRHSKLLHMGSTVEFPCESNAPCQPALSPL